MAKGKCEYLYIGGMRVPMKNVLVTVTGKDGTVNKYCVKPVSPGEEKGTPPIKTIAELKSLPKNSSIVATIYDPQTGNEIGEHFAFDPSKAFGRAGRKRAAKGRSEEWEQFEDNEFVADLLAKGVSYGESRGLTQINNAQLAWLASASAGKEVVKNILWSTDPSLDSVKYTLAAVWRKAIGEDNYTPFRPEDEEAFLKLVPLAVSLNYINRSRTEVAAEATRLDALPYWEKISKWAAKNRTYKSSDYKGDHYLDDSLKGAISTEKEWVLSAGFDIFSADTAANILAGSYLLPGPDTSGPTAPCYNSGMRRSLVERLLGELENPDLGTTQRERYVSLLQAAALQDPSTEVQQTALLAKAFWSEEPGIKPKFSPLEFRGLVMRSLLTYSPPRYHNGDLWAALDIESMSPSEQLQLVTAIRAQRSNAALPPSTIKSFTENPDFTIDCQLREVIGITDDVELALDAAFAAADPLMMLHALVEKIAEFRNGDLPDAETLVELVRISNEDRAPEWLHTHRLAYPEDSEVRRLLDRCAAAFNDGAEHTSGSSDMQTRLLVARRMSRPDRAQVVNELANNALPSALALVDRVDPSSLDALEKDVSTLPESPSRAIVLAQIRERVEARDLGATEFLSGAPVVNWYGDTPIRIHYEAHGPADGEPIVLLMGQMMQLNAWPERFVKGLIDSGHRVIVLDNRDIGHSTKLAGVQVDSDAAVAATLTGRRARAPYSLGDMADDVAGLLEHLDIPQARIVGQSMGGMIAQEMALRHPKKVKSIVALSSMTGDPTQMQSTPEAMRAVTSAIAFTGDPEKDRDLFIEHSVVYQAFASKKYRDDERSKAAAAASWDRAAPDEGSYSRQLAAIYASGDRTNALALRTFGRDPGFLTLVHGRDDTLISPQAATYAAGKCSPVSASLLILDDMGHDLPVELCDQVVSIVAAAGAPKAGDQTPVVGMTKTTFLLNLLKEREIREIASPALIERLNVDYYGFPVPMPVFPHDSPEWAAYMSKTGYNGPWLDDSLDRVTRHDPEKDGDQTPVVEKTAFIRVPDKDEVYKRWHDNQVAVNRQYKIGDVGPAGGTIFSIESGTCLEAAPKDPAAQFSWKEAMAAAQNYKHNGFSDWYLPSLHELSAMYNNRDRIGGFSDVFYWSSSEDDASYAWYQSFSSGNQNYVRKSLMLYVRPVRAFSVG